MPKKIEKYAQEPVVFYLHKNRNFLRKLERQGLEQKMKQDAIDLKDQLMEQTEKMINKSRPRRRSASRKANAENHRNIGSENSEKNLKSGVNLTRDISLATKAMTGDDHSQFKKVSMDLKDIGGQLN